MRRFIVLLSIALNSAGKSALAGSLFTPANASAAGTAGEIAFDGGFVYLCTAANTWVRGAVATW